VTEWGLGPFSAWKTRETGERGVCRGSWLWSGARVKGGGGFGVLEARRQAKLRKPHHLRQTTGQEKKEIPGRLLKGGPQKRTNNPYSRKRELRNEGLLIEKI